MPPAPLLHPLDVVPFRNSTPLESSVSDSGIELFVYMDDIVIYADSLEEHNRKLKVLLARLQNSGLTLQPQKCRFLQKEIVYLGHVFRARG